MSYIRCLSNPENLYIWAGVPTAGASEVTVSKGCDGDKDKVFERMPQKAFHGVLRKWWKNHWHVDVGEAVEYQGAKIEATPDFKWALSYKSWPVKKKVVMWETTLHYICTTNNFKWAKE